MIIKNLNKNILNNNIEQDIFKDNNENKAFIFGNKGFLYIKKNKFNTYITYSNIVKIGKVYIDYYCKNECDLNVLNRALVYYPVFYIYTSDDNQIQICCDDIVEMPLYIQHKIKFKEINCFSTFIKWLFKCNFIDNPELEKQRNEINKENLLKNIKEIRNKLIEAIEFNENNKLN